MSDRGGKARFADAARVLAGATGRTLGWPPAQFWDATPAELGAVVESGGAPTAKPLSRREFERLMERDNG